MIVSIGLQMQCFVSQQMSHMSALTPSAYQFIKVSVDGHLYRYGHSRLPDAMPKHGAVQEETHQCGQTLARGHRRHHMHPPQRYSTHHRCPVSCQRYSIPQQQRAADLEGSSAPAHRHLGRLRHCMWHCCGSKCPCIQAGTCTALASRHLMLAGTCSKESAGKPCRSAIEMRASAAS